MRSVEYKCSQCNEVFWHELDDDEDVPEVLRHYCHSVKGYWPMLRRDPVPPPFASYRKDGDQ